MTEALNPKDYPSAGAFMAAWHKRVQSDIEAMSEEEREAYEAENAEIDAEIAEQRAKARAALGPKKKPVRTRARLAPVRTRTRN